MKKHVIKEDIKKQYAKIALSETILNPAAYQARLAPRNGAAA
jgi:hypothetical protein